MGYRVANKQLDGCGRWVSPCAATTATRGDDEQTQLPAQITKIETTDRKTGKTVVRYQVRVDGGVNPETGARRQVRRRYNTEPRPAGRWPESPTRQSPAGSSPARRSPSSRCASSTWPGATTCGPARVQGGLRPGAAAGAARRHAGAAAHQASHRRAGGRSAHRRHQDGEGPDPATVGSRRGEQGHPTVAQVLADAQRQGPGGPQRRRACRPRQPAAQGGQDLHRGRGSAAPRCAGRRPARARVGAGAVRAAPRRDRRPAVGRRRSGSQDVVHREQPGSAGGKTVENDPKSATSRRTLPLPDRLVIGAEGGQQAAGGRTAGAGRGLPVRVLRGVNEIGDPYSPAVLSRYWREAVKAAGCGTSSCTQHGTPAPH